MKFYQRLKPFKVISFDLDDTLYNNQPVMQTTEKKLDDYFASLLPEHPELDNKFWLYFRQQALIQQPALIHDVGALRIATYVLGFRELGFTEAKAQKSADQAYTFFKQHRSNFTVPSQSIQLLSQLADKLPLVAISNGNVDTKALGIDQYFKYIYHAGVSFGVDNTGKQNNSQSLKQKPEADMFHLACQQLNILPEELLHVGDCGQADIRGAVAAGCQAVWLSCYDVGKPLSVLPHLEITDIVELTQLFDY
ncbi:MAG: HAD-IA family hydrolase [Alteromonadaceae bacterium]|nr:HAD-IA family hydrolase [Alteromonadaceae bacterium]